MIYSEVKCAIQLHGYNRIIKSVYKRIMVTVGYGYHANIWFKQLELLLFLAV